MPYNSGQRSALAFAYALYVGKEMMKTYKSTIPEPRHDEKTLLYYVTDTRVVRAFFHHWRRGFAIITEAYWKTLRVILASLPILLAFQILGTKDYEENGFGTIDFILLAISATWIPIAVSWTATEKKKRDEEEID